MASTSQDISSQAATPSTSQGASLTAILAPPKHFLPPFEVQLGVSKGIDMINTIGSTNMRLSFEDGRGEIRVVDEVPQLVLLNNYW